MKDKLIPTFDTAEQLESWANDGTKSYNSHKDRLEEVLTQVDLLLKKHDLEVVTYGMNKSTEYFWSIVRRQTDE